MHFLCCLLSFASPRFFSDSSASHSTLSINQRGKAEGGGGEEKKLLEVEGSALINCSPIDYDKTRYQNIPREGKLAESMSDGLLTKARFVLATSTSSSIFIFFFILRSLFSCCSCLIHLFNSSFGNRGNFHRPTHIRLSFFILLSRLLPPLNPPALSKDGLSRFKENCDFSLLSLPLITGSRLILSFFLFCSLSGDERTKRHFCRMSSTRIHYERRGGEDEKKAQKKRSSLLIRKDFFSRTISLSHGRKNLFRRSFCCDGGGRVVFQMKLKVSEKHLNV